MHVTSLHIYPIKGCRGRVLASAEIDRLGLVGDRRLMLVDAHDRFLSQREVPALATIEPEVDGPMLTVRHDGVAPLSLELDPAGPTRDVRLWSDTIRVTDQGDDAAAWFGAVIGAPVRLVEFTAVSQRLLDSRFSPRDDAETAFADGYPLLVVLEESLADLNGRLDAPVPMIRFRPNVVVSGADAWSEDGWGELRIGDLVLDAVKPCARCTVPTVDQATGVRDPDQEPLRTLARLRTVPEFGAIFGQNVVPREPGRIAVGDRVEALGM